MKPLHQNRAEPALPRPITTLLVANRGEIARRVMRAARGLGIRTVAVFAEPDADAPHVHEADVAVALTGSTAAESYLDQEQILAAAALTGADAVHPGYGFLSEAASFATACASAGIVFVGPSPATVETMGLKDRAKDVARAAGVPVLPDALIAADDPALWIEAGAGVGYPLLVKATAGGGGKGMRLVADPADLVQSVEDARREAGSSFGNRDVFLEKYLTRPRHVEIQVFADTHGAAVHLLERECSVQRRHQKIIEEAPSSAVGPELRERMGSTAVSLVKELGYVGAGTVEFLLEEDGERFFFLEMNTRLQVEHPVTEEITGLDLVQLQLRVASGARLGIQQHEVRARGHAIEVRLYAEDPTADFAPSPGILHRYAHPAGDPDIRWEDGIGTAAEISPYYDPLLAKVVAHADTRHEAALRLARALEATELHGTVTNRDFLAAALRSADFLAGRTFTDFVDGHPELLAVRPATPEHVHLAAAVAVSVHRRRAADHLAGDAPPAFRVLPGHPASMSTWISAHDRNATVSFRQTLDRAHGSATLRLEILEGDDVLTHELRLRQLGPDFVRVRDGKLEWPCRVAVHPDGSVWVNDAAAQHGWIPTPRIPTGAPAALAAGPASDVSGVVVAILVAAGDQVTKGQRLVVVEAMKMERPVLAGIDGVVDAVHVAIGEYVDASAALVTLREEA